MGGPLIHHEPESTDQLQIHAQAWQIFHNSGWHIYFERLQGFDKEVSLEFALNLEGGNSQVRGMWIIVTEEAIAVVSGFPHFGQQWFTRKSTLLAFPEKFLQGVELVMPKGKGYDQVMLPQTWDDIALFIHKYITCEGCYSIIFSYHFMLLAYLCFQNMFYALNLSHYVLSSTNLMAWTMKRY